MSSCLATPPSPASLSLLPMVHPPWALDAAFKGTGIGQLGIGPYTKFPCVSKGAQQLARTTIAAARRFGSDRGYTGHVADIINATVLTQSRSQASFTAGPQVSLFIRVTASCR